MICIESCSEPSHTSKIELFAQIVNVLKLLTIFARNSQASIVNSLNLRNLSSRLRSSCKAFWWHLFCASENLFKIWAISLRAYLFERICLDFLWGATTIFFFFWAGSAMPLSAWVLSSKFSAGFSFSEYQ